MANFAETNAVKPLSPDMEEWDDFLKGRYREGKSQEEFRQYDEKATPGVAHFYKMNHENQTFDYVVAKEKEYFGLKRGQKSIWEAAEFLNTLVDESHPDTDLTRSSTCCRLRRRFARTVIRDGSWWLASYTTWGRYCASGASRSGVWWATRFRWAARFPKTSCFRSISRGIRTCTIRCIRPNTGYTSQTAGWRRCICLSGTTGISTK